MNRRGFVGAGLAGLAGFFFPQSKVQGTQCLVTMEVDEDARIALCEKTGNPYKPMDVSRTVGSTLDGQFAYIERTFPGMIRFKIEPL